jgi:hypothetical protein
MDEMDKWIKMDKKIFLTRPRASGLLPGAALPETA